MANPDFVGEVVQQPEEIKEGEILQQRVKETIQSVLALLEGFTDWNKGHILECVKEELNEAKLSDSLVAT